MTRQSTLHLAGALACALAACPLARAGQIVFSSDRGGAWRIWTAKDDGSGLRALTTGDGEHHDVDPMFDPDGKSVLFTSTRGGKPGVYLAAADGSKPRRLCDGDQAEWSPDGKRIVLRRAGRIVTRELATGKETPVRAKGGSRCSGPTWSPDGKWIAFARVQGKANAIFRVPAGGGKTITVYDKKPACEPHFSPDGKEIVFETETHVWAVRPDGTGPRMITYYGGLQRYPRFSPDGRSVIFCQGASTRGPWEIYVVGAAGGSPKKLTDGGSDMYPHWK